MSNQTCYDFMVQGTRYREQHRPQEALAAYGQAMIADPDSAAAFNNYGNTLRELGYPARAIPFLQHATILDPALTTAHFNLSVAYLLQGDYARGFAAYESRWNFEHLANTLPQYPQPRWTGQPLQGKTIFVRGEQGHGDMIQFVRFLEPLHRQGAQIHLQVTQSLVPLLANSAWIQSVTGYQEPNFEFDYWTPIMSLPQHLGITLENLPHSVQYITAQPVKSEAWRRRLGPKTRLRVGFCWSGRPDSWINQHKSVPFEVIVDLIRACPEYEWINMQIDATPEQEAVLADLGLKTYPGSIQDWSDTAGLMQNVDVFLGVDTALTHLAGAMGRPTWVMLSRYALDWRWLLDRDSSPWYATAKLFRQPEMGNWRAVTQQIAQYLSWFKV